jgi:hypothetical protein
MLRATLLYDTMVLRLDRSINRYDEYARFRRREEARWAKERWRKRTRDARRDLFLRVEELAEAGEDLMALARQTISSPVLNFKSLVEKWVFTLSVLSRTAARLVLLTAIAAGAVAASRYFRAAPAPLLDSLWTALRSRAYQAVVVAVVVLNTRDILFRLTDRDNKPRETAR